MLKFIKKSSDKIGIDGAIAYTILSRIIQAGGGVITLLFVARCLSKFEQGYYYTFGSILAIQIFFELGLSNIITQFVAHENASLIWNDKTSFSGSREAISRISSLLRFTVKWFGVIAILLFLGLLIVGYCFFNIYGKSQVKVDWQIPWLILSVTTSLSLMVSPILAFLEGLGRVREVAKIRFIQQIVQLLFALVFFSLGFKLFSSPVAAVFAFLIVPLWIFIGEIKEVLKFIWKNKDIYTVNYRLEIFPFQWKIAISWISGYFIFQLFNPVLFATEGPVVAGQMGMTLAILNAILMFSLSWVTTKIPVFSDLIAKKQYKELDTLFNKTLMQSSALNALALGVFYFLIFALRYFEIKIGGKDLANRLLPPLPMLFMIIPIFLNHIIAALATYLRCHKKEPMLLQSIVLGFFCCMSTIILGNFFGILGMTSGYMILIFIGFVWTYLIFISKKTRMAYLRMQDKLEIVIITYNRCKLLDNTLSQFLGSPFKDCKISILNNCSTDDTIAVCQNYLDKFPNFNIITNKYNIGANANILRAIEIVNSDFIWIVCDDDDYDFSYCEDVIDFVLNDKVDIINLGAHAQDEWKFGGQLKKAKKLFDEGYPFFKAASFVPNNIFRVRKFLPYNIAGYNNIINMYPHMPYLLSNFLENNLVYISKNRIVTAGIGEQVYNPKDWIQGWMNISNMLNKKSDIKKCFYSQLQIGFFNEIKSCLIILFGTITGIMYFKTLFKAFHLLSFFQKIIFIILAVPYFFYRFSSKKVLKKGVPC